MYPQLNIDLSKLRINLDKISEIVKNKANCSLMIVTKSYCADLEILKLIENSDVDYIADSRIENLRKSEKIKKEKVLLRLPMISEAEDVVKYADISLNSEIEVVKKLNYAQKLLKYDNLNLKKHKILLMIDVGDLREGIFYKNEIEIFDIVEEILKLEYIELFGLGVNLTCYGAVIPQYDNLSLLVNISKKIEKRFNIELKMLSGGNSSSLHLIEKNKLPHNINNLRIGEAFIRGTETAYGKKLKGLYDDAFVLLAEIIEIKEKPSVPIGDIGVDAFGTTLIYEDKGIIKRAIIAIGRQDINIDGLIPVDSELCILGASSDHLILDITSCKIPYRVGDVIKFKLTYSGILSSFTSDYVKKVYLE